MKYTFHLRNIKTGDTREYQDDYDWEEEDSMIFQWFQGNYSCDCNRSLFLYNWEREEYPCSASNIIVIDKIIREDKTEVYKGMNYENI